MAPVFNRIGEIMREVTLAWGSNDSLIEDVPSLLLKSLSIGADGHERDPFLDCSRFGSGSCGEAGPKLLLDGLRKGTLNPDAIGR